MLRQYQVCSSNIANSFRTTFKTQIIDDKMLMVWDLHPAADIESSPPASTTSLSPSPSSRSQPTAYVIPFRNPLTSIRSHPSTSKEFLVSDCCGAVYLTDWRSDPDEGDPGGLWHSSLVELIEPSALSVSCLGGPSQWSASVDWRSDTVDLQVLFFFFDLNSNFSQNWWCLWAKIFFVGHVETSRRNTVCVGKQFS
jgi:hypothetical protein